MKLLKQIFSPFTHENYVRHKPEAISERQLKDSFEALNAMTKGILNCRTSADLTKYRKVIDSLKTFNISYETLKGKEVVR
jgi:hypothetical protein